MTRYRIDLADEPCDAQLRKVAAAPMPGKVSLAFHCEPSYFGAQCVLGPERQTIVGRVQQTGEIIGLAARSVRTVYVQGTPTRVGYLSALRIVPHARNLGLLARGYRFLRQLHEQDPHRPDFYLTTIAEGNRTALELLTSGRAGLPRYHYLGSFVTLAIRRRKRPRPTGGYTAIAADGARLDDVLKFLNETGPARQLFPVYQREDFAGPAPVFRDLRPQDIRLIYHRGQLAGVVGLWDQRAFRQTVVHAYGVLLRSGRWVYNQWAAVAGRLTLPRPQEPLRQCFAAFPLVKENDLRAGQCLLETLAAEQPNDCEFVALGLCDNDPLLPLARRCGSFEYRTRIYAVSWNELPPFLNLRAERPYYLESGCL